MVKITEIYSTIFNLYNNALGDKAQFLSVGGSIGRGNFVNGWSDIDLLLVLDNFDNKSLRKIKKCEEKIKKKFEIDIDTMIVQKNVIEMTSPEKLHGKVKNFLYFISKTVILLDRGVKLPKIDYNKFVFGFWATYAEQEKNFLRRNADVDFDNNDALKKLFKKNIKIIFLLLKQFFAIKELVPCTYEDTLTLIKNSLPRNIFLKLNEYANIRKSNGIDSFSENDLKNEINLSVDIFLDISKIMVKKMPKQ